MEIYILIGTIIIALGLLQIRNWKPTKNLQQIASTRPSLDREDYITSLNNKGYEREYIELVYDEIYQFIDLPNFPIYPEDDWHLLYGINDLDDVELIDLICNKLNLQKPEQEDFDFIEKNIPL
ncbi:hypothetical protein [Marinifilum caeruleilacunae]|uniref:Uncharacterized protein n=1 Tax=Marinifilum caeruleilacunae TaxID=2499076 RepID=A0ABX1WQZ2_9BACT|nr:hypothetical protein [Marinifilum caeruleilacunae]NOU58502.1 hypothetical protein [Marinifilum caeruleilacunae]